MLRSSKTPHKTLKMKGIFQIDTQQIAAVSALMPVWPITHFFKQLPT
jgi:hypothetical protein